MVTDVATEPEADIAALAATEATDEPASPAPRSGPPAPGLLAVVLAIIMLASVVVVFFGVFAYGLSGLSEQRSQHELYARMRGLLDPSSPVAPPIGGVIPAGTPVALITSPKADLHNVAVVEGTTSGELLDGPGHLVNSPLPGQGGESVILGKSTTAGAPFGEIDRLRRGDVITVRTGQGRFHFTVEGRIAAGTRPHAVRASEGFLTLVTATGSGGLGTLAPNHLIYVLAKLQGKAVNAPSGRPTTVPTATLQGQNDAGAWPWVAVWLVGLALASAGCWWLWSRLGILRTWMVGAPILFGILWGLSNEAIRLLPNVY
jgi:sortase A